MKYITNQFGQKEAQSEDVRAVKERDSSSRGASLVGSIPTLRIEVSLHLLQVRPLQFMGFCISKMPTYNRHSSAVERVALSKSNDTTQSRVRSPLAVNFFYKTKTPSPKIDGLPARKIVGETTT